MMKNKHDVTASAWRGLRKALIDAQAAEAAARKDRDCLHADAADLAARRCFFFKQKTAYDLSECDWSSDVCSSDLLRLELDPSSEIAEGMRGEIASWYWRSS